MSTNSEQTAEETGREETGREENGQEEASVLAASGSSGLGSGAAVWFGLKLEHSYFDRPRISELLRLHPGEECVRHGVAMRGVMLYEDPEDFMHEECVRHGVAMREVSDTILVYSRRLPGALENTKPPPSLTFAIEFLDRAFFNYTQLKEASRADQAETTILSLSADMSDRKGKIDASNALRIPLRPVGPAPANEEDRVQAYYSDALYHRPFPAVFEWRPGNGAATTKPPIYTLKFEARATYWRYLLMGMPAEARSGAQIKLVEGRGNGNGAKKNGGEDSSVEFKTLPELLSLPGGREALVIVSDQPIPLRAAPSCRVMLQSAPPIDSMRLPNPGKDLSRMESEDGQEVWATDIFVQF